MPSNSDKFEAKLIKGKLVIKPNITKDKKGNIKISVPSLPIIEKFKKLHNKTK